MLSLCDELRAEVRPVPDILLGAGLRVMNFADLKEEDARFPHLAAMHTTMARVDHWAHSVYRLCTHSSRDFTNLVHGLLG